MPGARSAWRAPGRVRNGIGTGAHHAVIALAVGLQRGVFLYRRRAAGEHGGLVGRVSVLAVHGFPDQLGECIDEALLQGCIGRLGVLQGIARMLDGDRQRRRRGCGRTCHILHRGQAIAARNGLQHLVEQGWAGRRGHGG